MRPIQAPCDTVSLASLDPPMDVEALEQAALAAVAAASSTDAIEAVRVEYLGRKSELKLALREVRDRETGMTLNAARERIEAAVAAREAELERAELDRRLAEERADVTLPVGGYERGHLHLITQIRREVEDVFLGLGYRVVDGREVESTRYNFDGLNFPPGHPARSPLASLFLDTDTLLRPEASPSQVRTMEAQEPPVYIVSLGRVYRRDTPDATHTPVFRHSGWIEVGGAGMVDPKLFEFVGYDPERYSGFAFGWGLERIAMLRHEFPDLRELWRNDLRFSRQF